jgi:hypothetical protein
LAEVEVTTPEGKWRYATGIGVAPGRVLTSRHVLAGGWKEIKVRFPRLAACDWAGALVATVAWPSGDAALQYRAGDGVPDALVLRVEQAAQGLIAVLSKTHPSPGTAWSSEGFPRGAATGRTGGLEPLPLRGAVAAAATKAARGWERLHLNVDGEPDNRLDWGGASGAPVFIAGAVHGVIAEVLSTWSGRLQAVSIAELLEHEGFGGAVGWDAARAQARERRRSEVRGTLSHLLSQSPRAEEALREALHAAERHVGPGTSGVIDELLELELGLFARVCRRARARLRGEDAKVVVELVQQVAPLSGAALAQRLHAEGDGILSAPVTTFTLLEVVVAAEDGRSLRLAILTNGRKEARGEYELSQHGVPEWGKSTQAAVDQIRNHLLNLLVDEVATKGLRDEHARTKLDELLQMHLQTYSEPLRLEPYRYYFGYESRDVEGQAIAAELCRRLPEVRCVSFERTSDKDDVLVSTLLAEILLTDYSRPNA